MKVIINKATLIQGPNKNFLLRSDLLKLVVNTPPEKGIPIAAMRDRIKILDVLDSCTSGSVGTTVSTGFEGSDIHLEDAQFTSLKKLFDEYAWRAAHKDIIDLADHLDEVAKTK